MKIPTVSSESIFQKVQTSHRLAIERLRQYIMNSIWDHVSVWVGSALGKSTITKRCTCFENSSLNTLKNLWICLILLKNRCLKYRFFALFRQAFRDVPFGSSVVSWALSSSLIFSPSLNDLPEKCTESELFAGFSRHIWVNLLRHDALFRLTTLH